MDTPVNLPPPSMVGRIATYVSRLVFKLPLRQAEGFLRSVLSLMGVDLEAPDHAEMGCVVQIANAAQGGQVLTRETHTVTTKDGQTVATRLPSFMGLALAMLGLSPTGLYRLLWSHNVFARSCVDYHRTDAFD